MLTLKPLRKITLILILIASFPAAFLVYELNSLNQNEKIIREIYRNQLDAILFSVNQYSDDVINSWANKINNQLQEKNSAATTELATRLGDVNAIAALYLSDLQGKSVFHLFHEEDSTIDFNGILKGVEQANQEKLEKLVSYYDAGFRKMETFDTIFSENFVPIFFVMDKELSPHKVAVMVLDVPAFIQNSLGPKMQSIAEDKFLISVLYNTTSSVYSTAVNHPADQGPVANEFMRDLWILPHYSLGISLQNATLDDLTKERTRNAFILLVFLMVILATGLTLLYRNIRYEIKLSQAKTEFVSNVSHEIRTPLSLISMYAETLEMDRVSEDKKKDYYSIISKEAARLTGIVNRILNFSKADANKKEYSMQLVDLNELCEEVLESYLPVLRQNGFTIDFTPDPDIELINADRNAVGEALVNLLDNAMKYSRENKHIILRTGGEKQMSFLEVQDHGIGIPRAYQKDIFEQFYRAPMGNVHNTKGSGLGLALVKKTMDAHKGSVKVESALDKGSTFRLYFPVLITKVA